MSWTKLFGTAALLLTLRYMRPKLNDFVGVLLFGLLDGVLDKTFKEKEFPTCEGIGRSKSPICL